MDTNREQPSAAAGKPKSSTAEAAPSETMNPTAANQPTASSAGDGAEKSAAANMSYIDRVVSEVEDSDDDTSDPGLAGGVGDTLASVDEDGSGEDRDEDSCSNWSGSDDELDEEPSDDELEYDSDEETSIKVSTQDVGTHKFRGNLDEDSKEILLWRKEDSFSDWTIEVSAATSGGCSKTVYNVHKFALGAGPNKSEYFETVFKSGRFNESLENASEVTLSEDVAKFFPDFLDYLYSHPSERACLINRDNRRSLQYLASYFIVPELVQDVRDFVQEDMHNLDHMEGYLSEFGSPQDEESRKMLSIAGGVCYDKILSIEIRSSLLTKLPPAMILQMISKARSSKDITSLLSFEQNHICLLALEYLRQHQASLDAGFFHALASDLYFPDDDDLAGCVAINLLELIKLNGWDSHENRCIVSICTAALSRFAANEKLALGRISFITKNIPEQALRVLLAESWAAKNEPNTETESIADVCCKKIDNYGRISMGTTMKVSIQSTDSINFIRYLVSRHWNIPMDDGSCLAIFHEGEHLENEQLVSNCDISSGTELGVYGWLEYEGMKEDESTEEDGSTEEDEVAEEVE